MLLLQSRHVFVSHLIPIWVPDYVHSCQCKDYSVYTEYVASGLFESIYSK